jgi:hypothetical protein
LGTNITRQQVEEITAMATKHGFHSSGFCSFECEAAEEQTNAVRHSVRQAFWRS